MAASRLLAALAAAAAATAWGQSGRVPVIIDTDFGQDMDDTWAIWYMLASPEVEVRLIVTATRCTTARAQLLAKWLTDAGYGDVPIAVGIPNSPYTPWAGVGCNGTGAESGCDQGFFVGPSMPYADNFDLNTYRGKVYLDGVQAMAAELERHPSTTLLALAPLTNVAALQASFPHLTAKADVFAMAGSVKLGYHGSTGPDSEYNVYADGDAARAVLRNAGSWRSFAVAPLDTCNALQLAGDDFQAIVEAAKVPGSPAAATMAMYRVWEERGCDINSVWCSSCSVPCSPGVATSVLFDLQPAYMAIGDLWRRDLVVQELRLDVNGSQFTVVSDEGGLANVTMEWNSGGLESFTHEAMRRFAPHGAQKSLPA